MNEIEKLIQNELEENIDKILTNKIKFYSCKYNNPAAIRKCLESLGFVDNEDFDTNGWQWDFWFSMKHPTYGKLNIAGSGYYGRISIEKSDEEDDN